MSVSFLNRFGFISLLRFKLRSAKKTGPFSPISRSSTSSRAAEWSPPFSSRKNVYRRTGVLGSNGAENRFKSRISSKLDQKHLFSTHFGLSSNLFTLNRS